jgi:hypothetical protein
MSKALTLDFGFGFSPRSKRAPRVGELAAGGVA